MCPHPEWQGHTPCPLTGEVALSLQATVLGCEGGIQEGSEAPSAKERKPANLGSALQRVWGVTVAGAVSAPTWSCRGQLLGQAHHSSPCPVRLCSCPLPPLGSVRPAETPARQCIIPNPCQACPGLLSLLMPGRGLRPQGLPRRCGPCSCPGARPARGGECRPAQAAGSDHPVLHSWGSGSMRQAVELTGAQATQAVSTQAPVTRRVRVQSWPGHPNNCNGGIWKDV